MAGTIAPERILREMADLWVTLGKQGEGEAGVLRACTMTLVVAAEESDDAQAIGETLAALMPEHPSRAIVIRFREGDQRALSARVFAQCWMPFGHRQQICCEQIEITGSDSSLPDLAAAVVPLVAPDLPVILWCRAPRLFHLADFPQLETVAQKVVVDSCAFGDTVLVLRELSEAVEGGRLFADFSWTRLTRWRQLIAQIFENRVQLANLPSVSEVRISYPGSAPPAPAYYVGAWLLDCLRKIGGKPHLRFESAGGEATGRLQNVDLLSADAKPVASIGLVEGHAAEVRAGELATRALLPALTDYSLMREELSIPGRDAAFEAALAGAAKLALS